MSVVTRYKCDFSAKAGTPNPDVVLDEDPDYDVPLGWLQIVVSRAVVNPDFTAAVLESERTVEQLRAAMTADGVDEATQDQTLAQMERQHQAAFPAEYLMQQRVLHIHPEEAAGVLASLRIEALS